MKFRKKPVVVEAVQWTGQAIEGLPEWCGDVSHITLPVHHVNINTLEGTMSCHLNDWIIRGVKGEIYPCKPDIFEMTYEPVKLDTMAVALEVARKSQTDPD